MYSSNPVSKGLKGVYSVDILSVFCGSLRGITPLHAYAMQRQVDCLMRHTVYTGCTESVVKHWLSDKDTPE